MRTLFRQTAIPFTAATLAGVFCWIVCGRTLGLFFGGIAMAGLLLPTLLARDQSLSAALLTAAGVVDGIGLIWLMATIGNFSLLQWLQAYMVLIAVAMALLGLQKVLRSPVVTVIFIAWLAWPVWLSPWINTTLANALAPSHPLFALNRVFIDVGVWTQQRLMYQLTSLAQDVPYELPRSIIPCVAAHLIIGLALITPVWWWKRPEESAQRQSEASPAA